jgi:methyltransferase (TIGR00027 family)
MKEDQISQMALWGAYVRAFHATHDRPTVFDDFLAPKLLTEEERELFDQRMQDLMEYLQSVMPSAPASFPNPETGMAWVMQEMTVSLVFSRARYAEDKLAESIARGVRQCVILGAGMDTFAFRHPEMLPTLEVFEVDHPAMQAFKKRRLEVLGWQVPPRLHFIPVDFVQQSLSVEIGRSSFDQEVPSFFSWLGVTYYLSRDAVLAMLRDISKASSSGSTLVFDYFDPDIFLPGVVAPRVRGLMSEARLRGEPMKTALDPSSLDADLASVGLRLHENLDPDEIQARYFDGRNDGYHACEHAHIACAVVE